MIFPEIASPLEKFNKKFCHITFYTVLFSFLLCNNSFLGSYTNAWLWKRERLSFDTIVKKIPRIHMYFIIHDVITKTINVTSIKQ